MRINPDGTEQLLFQQIERFEHLFFVRAAEDQDYQLPHDLSLVLADEGFAATGCGNL